MRNSFVLPAFLFPALVFLSLHAHAQTGKVGIGTTTPQAHLHVNNPGGGTSLTIGESAQSGGFTALNIATSAASNGFSSLQSVSKAGSTWGNLILNASGGNVGIGTVFPFAKLDIAGKLRIADGTQGDGKVFKTDANGIGSWQTLDGKDLLGASIPANLYCPALIAPLAVGNSPYDIVLSGNYGIVGGFDGSLKVVDISNPAALTVVGSVASLANPSAFAVSGNYIYVVSGNGGGQVINILDPAAPAVVGTFSTSGDAGGIAVSGNYAYVTNADKTLQVFNITNPATPTVVGTATTGSEPSYIAISGTYAYVTNAPDKTLQVFNIANPLAPTLAGSVATANSSAKVVVAGNYAYVTNYNGNTFQVIDITNPATPVVKGTVSTDQFPIGFTIAGSYAYITCYGGKTLQVINISNPASPVVVGSASTGGSSYSIAVKGSNAFVANTSDNTVQTFNLACNINYAVTVNSSTGQTAPVPMPWITSVNNISNANTGNVGIGIATPAAKLEVSGTGGIRVSSSNTGTGTTDWIAANIGGTTGDRVVAGLLNGVATIGAHTNTLSGWANLAINADGGFVGIGVPVPVATLDVKQSGWFRNNPGGNLAQSAGAGLRLTTENKIASIYGFDYSTGTSINLLLQGPGGRVGIGTTTPGATLDVKGDGKFGSFLRIGTDALEGYFQNAQDGAYRALQTGGTQGYFFQNYNGVNTAMYVGLNGTYAGKVGIGNAAPVATLDVTGNIKIADGTQGAGKVLTSDANGLASWATAAAGAWTVSGNNIYSSNSGNVGIGTSNPAENLSVSKTAGATAGTQNLLLVETVVNPLVTSTQGIVIRKDDGQKRGFKLVQDGSDDNNSLFKIASFNGGADIDRFVIRRDNGSVGIGTIAPETKLTVVGNANITGGVGVGTAVNDGTIVPFRVNSGTQLNWKGGAAFGYTLSNVIMGELGGVATIGGHNGTLSGWGNLAINTGGGNVGIGTATPSQKLSVSGNICYTGSIGACSDIRYKKGITPLTGSLNKVLEMQGVYYYWKTKDFPDKQFNDLKQIGFIAQDVEKLYPELVITDADGYKSVDYSKVTPILTEAIKELKAENDQLKATMEQLKADTEKRLKLLEEKLNK